jgi:hypothetical protein
VAAQRGHITPEAPHTPAADHRGRDGATSTKTKSRACPTWTDPSTEYARTLRHLQASDTWWRTEKNRAQPYALGTQGVIGLAGSHMPFLWRRPPAPAAYGWIGQQSGSGFFDLAPSILHYNWF